MRNESVEGRESFSFLYLKKNVVAVDVSMMGIDETKKWKRN